MCGGVATHMGAAFKLAVRLCLLCEGRWNRLWAVAKDLGRAPWLDDLRKVTRRDPRPEPDPDPEPEPDPEQEEEEASEELDEEVDFCWWCWFCCCARCCVTKCMTTALAAAHHNYRSQLIAHFALLPIIFI